VLAAPTLSASDKQQIVQELTKHIGQQDKEGVVKNFLSTLAENNRLGVLEGVVEKFGVLMGAYRGEVELTVTSAAVSRTSLYERRASIRFSCFSSALRTSASAWLYTTIVDANVA
jgi:hypothetical protein